MKNKAKTQEKLEEQEINSFVNLTMTCVKEMEAMQFALTYVNKQIDMMISEIEKLIETSQSNPEGKKGIPVDLLQKASNEIYAPRDITNINYEYRNSYREI